MNKANVVTIIRLMAKLILLLIGASFLTLMLLELSPIDPVASYVRGKALVVGHSQLNLIQEEFGVGQPLLVKYFLWLKQVLQGDLGVSLIYKVPVGQLILEKFSASFLLLFGSWLLGGVIGYLFGILTGIYENRWLAKVSTVINYLILSTPTFWLGMLLIIIFSVKLNWLPTSLSSPIGIVKNEVTWLERLQHLLLPLVTLAWVSSSHIMLFSKQKVVSEKQQPYYTFFKANGRTNFKSLSGQLLPNTIMPALVLQFASIGEVFGGSILVEQVFSYPGLGKMTVDAGLGGDIPLIMGIVLFMTVIVFCGNQLVELFRKKIDPRMGERYGGLS